MANGGQIDLGQIIVNLSRQGGRAVGDKLSRDVNMGKDVLQGLLGGAGTIAKSAGTGLSEGLGLDIPTAEAAPVQQPPSMTEQQQMALSNILGIAQVKSQEKQALQKAVEKQLGQNANQYIEIKGVKAAQQQLLQRESELSQLQQQAMNVMQQPEPNFMQRFFRGGASALGVDLGEVSGQKGKARELANIGAAQSILGEEPLQQSQIQALDIAKKESFENKRGEFFESMLNPKPMSSEATTQYTLSSSVDRNISELKDILSQNENALESFATPGNKLGQRINDIIGQIKANLVAARGGKNLTKNEEKIIDSLIPKKGFSAKLQDISSVMFQLDSLQSDVNRQMNLLNPNENLRTMTRGLMEQGYGQEEIYDLYQRKGLVP